MNPSIRKNLYNDIDKKESIISKKQYLSLTEDPLVVTNIKIFVRETTYNDLLRDRYCFVLVY